jgi:hypothetical protein
MKDEVASKSLGGDRAPLDPQQRLPYLAPVLTDFGDSGSLTQAVGSRGQPDGGLTFGFMSSSV